MVTARRVKKDLKDFTSKDIVCCAGPRMLLFVQHNTDNTQFSLAALAEKGLKNPKRLILIFLFNLRDLTQQSSSKLHFMQN